MKTFAGKSAASADKVRGGYYTPAPVARFLARWVRQAGPKILEPSCGDGRILRELAALTGQARGVEFVALEAAKSREFAPVDAESLFTWLPRTAAASWDGVAGNPPYIRFGNWAPDQREPALELMKGAGLRPTRLTNAWVPFVVASATLVREGGRGHRAARSGGWRRYRLSGSPCRRSGRRVGCCARRAGRSAA